MKKTILYSLLAALLMAVAVPAGAQKSKAHKNKTSKTTVTKKSKSHRSPDDAEVMVEALKHVLEKHSINANNFVDVDILPKYKKNVKVLTEIGRAYSVEGNDSDRAVLFTHMALELDRKYVPAYVAMGDIYRRWSTIDETLKDRAFEWYDKAIAVDPKDPQGYKSYADFLARTDQQGAINKMNEILKYVPDYDVNLYAARLYFDMGGETGLENSYLSFLKTNAKDLSKGDFASYVTVLRMKKDYNAADSILQIAYEKYPTHVGLNRFRLQNYISLEKWDSALEAVDILLTKSDSLELDLEDYINYGLAYKGLKRYKNAIETFQKCVDFELKREDYLSDERFENAKKQETKHKGKAMEEIASSYKEMGFFEEAIAEQLKYIEYKKGLDKLDAPEIGDLASYYQEYADELGLMGKLEEQKEAIKKWYDTYELLAEVAPRYAVMSYYQRIRIASSLLDPGNKNGYAIPDAEKIIELVPSIDEATSTEKERLTFAIRYLMNYYVNIYTGKDKFVKIGPYWKLLGQLDSTDELYVAFDNRQARKWMGI